VNTPPLNNVHVRRAIEWGINRPEILSNVLKNIGSVAQGPIPPPSWAYKKGFAPYSYNINNAKKELALAGVSHVAFTLLITSGSPLNTQEAQFIQSELQPAGITVNIVQSTAASYADATQNHKFQAALMLWSGRPDPDGNVYTWFHTGGGINFMGYSNPQVDALLDAARVTNNQATRALDYQQAQQIILQDASFVFINYGVSEQASTTHVKNFTVMPSGIMEFTNVYLG
jgi:peptide/nickel transport system substrate-binding protein